ncbi:MAG: M56 family metallopeptidase [Maledivibacter sp.]|jgi:beta-lactamase regulating signal transducer with metallopeptidase domain|nr:M56 family metallopeptidase [Maledivibacter sp.]
MNDGIKLILSLSLSASILAIILFGIKPMIKHRLSKSVQYYIWIIVLLRLIVPFSFQDSIMDRVFYSDNHLTNIHNGEETNIKAIENIGKGSLNPPSSINQRVEKIVGQGININLKDLFVEYAMYIWLLGALIVFTINITGYIRFIGQLKGRYKPARNMEINILSKLLNGSKNVRLLRNGFISTPMALGILRPCIIIPDDDFDEVQLKNILLHELTHLKHHDILVKWLTMLATSIHWFNPIMYFIRKEISDSCELACDEAVIRNFSTEEKQAYGDTLISFAEEAKYPIGVLQATMCEEKKSLRERLIAIMKHDRKSKMIMIFSAILIGVFIFGALYLGGALDNKIEESSNLTGDAYNLSEISKYRTAYVGDNSKVGHIAANLPVPDNYFKQQYTSMETSKKPYSLTIYYEAAKDDEFIGEWPITKSNSSIETNSRINALIAFCMIDNVDKVTFAFRNSQSKGKLDESKYNTTFSFPRTSFEEEYGDLSRLGDDIVLLKDILEGKKSLMKGLELYVWRNKDITGNNSIHYTLLIGTNRSKSKSEIYDMNVATSDLEIIKQELSKYRSDTSLFIMQDIDIDKNIIKKINEELSSIIKNIGSFDEGIDFDQKLTALDQSEIIRIN